MPSLKRSTATVSRPIAIFGDVDLGIWGLLINDEQPRLAIAALDADPAEIRLQPAAIDRDDDEIWSVTSGAHSLRLEMGQATTLTPGGDPGLQPLRVTGTTALRGETVEIDVAGVPVTAADIRRMGTGGLLMEIVARGQLREGAPDSDEEGPSAARAETVAADD